MALTAQPTRPDVVGALQTRQGGLEDGLMLDLLDRHFSEQSFAELGVEGLSSEHWEEALVGPAREVLSRPGRRFRATLVELAWELSGGIGPLRPEWAIVVEAIHAGSLVVDDVEDGSVSRRGRPTLHRLYGVPRAINTGSWLYFWPHELVSRLALRPEVELQVRRLLARTELLAHQGQALDLTLRASELGPEELMASARSVARLKSGSLMELAATLGSLAAGAPGFLVERVAAFGRELGTALQHLDDLGGILSVRMRDKGYEDLRQDRVTFVWGYAAEKLPSSELRDLQKAAREAVGHPIEGLGAGHPIEGLGAGHPIEGLGAGDPIEGLGAALRAIAGDGARRFVRSRLEESLQSLIDVLGPSSAALRMGQEIDRLERNYE